MKRCPYCQTGITPTRQFGIVTCPTCEEVVGIGDLIEDGQYEWEWQFDQAFERVRRVGLELKARFCPICGKDCGEADYEPDDHSVGIFGSFWFNICEDHGEFATLEPDGKQEQWKEPNV